MNTAPKRVVILISGSGSNMEALIRASLKPGYPAKIVGVMSDKEDAGGLSKAAALGVPASVFERANYPTKTAHEGAILGALDLLAPDIICLAGYMRILSTNFIQQYRGRILNIHPSLLPLFQGLDTHQRALEAGMKLAGCTVHVVTEGIDDGPILAQAAVPILYGDSAEKLARRILAAEHQLYPAALAKFAGSRDFASDPGTVIVSLG